MTKDVGPGVKVPPPLAILSIVAIAEILQRFGWPILLDFYNTPIAIILGLLGTALSGIAFISFRHFKTNIMPHHPDQNLMTSGIFSYSRNPIYVSFFLYQLMFAFALHNMWTLLLMPISYLFLRYYVISKEERYLSQLFADEYIAYLKQARRWF